MKRQKVRSKMGVKEKALTAASSIASGDFLRMVTSAGAARKIDYSKLAKAIVEEYNGSTIAGSAQTLKAALDSLNSNMHRMIVLTGTEDKPIQIQEAGDDDYKGIAVYDKNNVERYLLVFTGGNLRLVVKDASGTEIKNKLLG